ncbi:MAG: hypothetical protein C5B51_27575 [Terriglobia bacterium]|nr:MAG: hypothetical protein C5B51_27575 [Terriglobia bacterium]
MTSGLCVCGTRWGFFLATELRKFYSGPLYLCGRDAGRTPALARRLKAAGFFLEWQSAVSDPRIRTILLALPHHLHRPVAEAAIAQGKHVFVEKPIAHNREDADAMIRAARQAGVVLAVGENVPFRPDIRLATSLLAEIGAGREVHTMAVNRTRPAGWRTQPNEMGGGVLIDFGVHHVRAVRILLGEPHRVYATAAPQTLTEMEGEDNATVLLEGTGWHASIHVSWAADIGRHPEFLVIADGGSLKLWPHGRYVDLYTNRPGWRSRLVSHIKPWRLQQALRSPEAQRQRRTISGDPFGYQAELREFLQAAARGTADTTSAEQARRDLEVVQAAYQSMASGKPVDLRPPAAPVS